MEFNSTPQILFNYTETDLRNPTTVKNSFTKSISVQGTKQNNDTFGHFWNLERQQDYGGQVGPGFNPMTKTDFTLYVGGALYEKGYAKLNSVENDGKGNTTYNLTLYGGVGRFLSSLSYRADDESDTKLTLADLNYNFVEGDSIENYLEQWTIDKDEIWNAWGRWCGYGSESNPRHLVINYVPTYGGTPQDFSNDKVLINCNDFPEIVHTVGYDGYKPVYNGVPTNYGYALGTYDGDLTPWVTFDLRSYLMQPAINLYYVIRACCNPDINGGYEVQLDPHFFNHNNPYYGPYAWMTLPSFNSLTLSKSSGETVSTPSLQRQSGSRRGDLFNVTYNGTLPSLSNTSLVLRVGFTPSDSTNALTLYTDTNYKYIGSRRVTYESAGGCIVQLWAMDRNNNIVGTSNAYLLSSTQNKANSNTPLWWNYYKSNELDTPAPYTWLNGVWKKQGNSYIFCDRNNNPVDIKFRLNTNVAYDHLVMKIKWPYSYYTRIKYQGIRGTGTPYYYPENDNMDNYYEVNATGFPMYTVEAYTGNTYESIEDVLAINRVRGSFNYTITRLETSTTDYDSFISGSKVGKKELLSGDKTPADVLLSYAKLFGLYFYYDPQEEASDPAAAPNGVIHIYDRNSFFTEEQLNLEELIDNSKPQTITPTVAVTKWLSFNTEQVESQANNDYKTKYGYEYGRQLVNTSYNYDLGTTDLYDGSCFKGAIMVREKNNLYAMCSYEDESVSPTRTGVLPYYALGGRLTYNLYKLESGELDSSDDYDINTTQNPYFSYNTLSINNLGLKFYDSFPKIQCHTEDNSPSDGSGILLFLNGKNILNAQAGLCNYYITDDVYDMAVLNDETPCYLLTQSEFDINGNRIARKIDAVPNFTRDWITGGQQEGYIVQSWHFGHPQETFVPNVFSTEGDSIYDICWKNYISDLYDVNTKSFTANVKLDNANVGLLRKYFWFRNGLWRLNAIKDYNVNSYDTTQCEFIKVQDPDNYKLAAITVGGSYYLVLDSYEIGATGGTIGGTVYLQSGGRWFLGDVLDVRYINGTIEHPDADTWVSPTQGSGQSSRISVSIPANTSAYTRYITVYIEYEDYPRMEATITQYAPQAAPYLEFNEGLITVNAEQHTIGMGFVKQNMRTGLTTSVTYTGPQNGWITDISINETTNQLTASVAANNGYQRSAIITLSGTGINGTPAQTTLQVDQTSGGPSELFVEPDPLTFDYLETSGKSMYVTYGGNWTITTQDE